MGYKLLLSEHSEKAQKVLVESIFVWFYQEQRSLTDLSLILCLLKYELRDPMMIWSN